MTELSTVRATRIPENAWVPAGMETLPAGWVNVHIRVDDLGHTLYRTEPCPGAVVSEARDIEVIDFLADENGNACDEDGTPYSAVVVIDRLESDPPHSKREFLDENLAPAIRRGGGYLGTVREDRVPDLLARAGHADARPDCR